MAFINEYISKEDEKKYNLEYLYEKNGRKLNDHAREGVRWTIDRESFGLHILNIYKI